MRKLLLSAVASATLALPATAGATITPPTHATFNTRDALPAFCHILR